jgi:hypothetical protein
MSPADAVFSYCRFVWMSQTNVSVISLTPTGYPGPGLLYNHDPLALGLLRSVSLWLALSFGASCCVTHRSETE